MWAHYIPYCVYYLSIKEKFLKKQQNLEHRIHLRIIPTHTFSKRHRSVFPKHIDAFTDSDFLTFAPMRSSSVVLSLPEVSPEGVGDWVIAAWVEGMDPFCLMLSSSHLNNAWTRVSAINMCWMNDTGKPPTVTERTFHLMNFLRCMVPHNLLGLCARKILTQGGRAAIGWNSGSCLSVSSHDLHLRCFPADLFPRVSIQRILHRRAYK